MISLRAFKLSSRSALPNMTLRWMCEAVLSAVSANIQKLSTSDSKLHQLWINRLQMLDNEAARRLILELTPDNSLGYSPPSGAVKEGTLVE